MKNRPTLTAAIITYNEEENIGDCLESITDLVDGIIRETSLPFCDETYITLFGSQHYTPTDFAMMWTAFPDEP